ncbi:MAG TPA: asparagine synthase (glutamine-hydrolyzing) [Acidobacteriaceae bacterium]|jgi:asparagine synthase (glutamine-hydrolysing)|nr:asparagine synthase (glutamine-hydrolyzing) [Acidobacteriaceae bacterium]
MCGICGKLNFNREKPVSNGLLKRMADTIVHRGPDDEGYYFSGPVGLGFRRLSIIDLATGHQPLSNEDGTVWIVFNGEIYNFEELRDDLLARGHIFRTRTDTEVIVHLYEEYGPACVERLRGMFGFAIWDERQKSLMLARDRVGIKPLYYAIGSDSIVFGSEIKAILADPEVSAQVRPEIVDRFLTFYYVPGEDTLFENVLKLRPGSYMMVRDGKAQIHPYWDLTFNPTPRSDDDAATELIELLDESVRLHMIADVPVGVLLSGGVDSTAMVSFASSRTDHTLGSFTLGFSSTEIPDERPFARIAAERYGTNHQEMTISAADFRDFLPQYAWFMEEPVCEAPAIALYYVTKLARESVKVLISGEGGDEAFAGYQTYRGVLWVERLKSALGPIRGPLSSAAGAANKFLNNPRIAKYGPLLAQPFESYYYSRSSGPASYFNQNLGTLYSSDFASVSDKAFATRPMSDIMASSRNLGLVNRMLYVDTKSSLPDDLLLKADKMTMANSIELRVPFLDHKLLEFAASLPENQKVRGLTTKYIAKRALASRIPEPILKRRKAGFPVPFNTWLRTDLKGYVHDVLLDRTTLERGYFNRATIEGLLKANAESGAYAKEVLSLLTLELWHRAFLTANPGVSPELARV